MTNWNLGIQDFGSPSPEMKFSYVLSFTSEQDYH